LLAVAVVGESFREAAVLAQLKVDMARVVRAAAQIT
jgi:hypothetical protein